MAINVEATTVNSQPTNKQPEQDRGYLGGGIFGAPIPRSVSSEYLNKITAGLIESYKSASPDFDIKVHSIDRSNEQDLFYSLITVAASMKSSPKLVAAHVLLIEASGDIPRPVQVNIMDQQIDVMRTSSDAFDEKLYKIVYDYLSRTYQNQNIVFVDGCVVPTEFDPTNADQIHSLALNAGTAVGTELRLHASGFRDLNIYKDFSGLQTEIEISFDRRQIVDNVGMPMRSDIVVNFANRKPTTSDNFRNSLNSGSRDMRMSQASGFIDLLFAPQQQTGNIWNMSQQNMQQKFAPNLVITALQSEVGYTPAMVLMALVSMTTVNNNSYWVQSFRPTVTRNDGKNIDMTDIGAINIEGNLNGAPGTKFGEYIDVKSQNVRPEEINALIAGLIYPGLVISLDIPDCGNQTWYLSLFRDASLGKVSAVKTIYAAANELTNGEFAKNFSETSPMFESTGSAEPNRIHLGYWTDGLHNIRDVRDFDYLAAANLLGRNNPQYIADWTDTFLAVNYPLQWRLNARKKFIDDMSNFTAKYKGFATRVTFSTHFIQALIKSCMDAGLVPVVKVPSMGMDFARQRGVASYAQGAMMAPGMSFGNQGGFTNFQTRSFGGNAFGSRW